MASGGAGEASFTFEGLSSTKATRITEISRSGVSHTAAQSNSLKEELCLEYVEAFRTQFTEIFPRRRRLFLTVPNEAGVTKFVCCTLRSTQLPFRDIYDHKECASFIADYFLYEPLADPLNPPTHLPSPYQVLNWRMGDCFDMSVVLASYLLGNGYDAYCVVGTAPRWITLRDTSRDECPFVEPNLPDDPGAVDSVADAAAAGSGAGASDAAAAADEAAKAKYVVAEKPPLESAYEKAMRARREAEEEAARKKASGETLTDEDVPGAAELDAPSSTADVEPAVEEDPYAGRRIHCWVLVRAGRRDLDHHVFIEPSTGRVYPVEDSPYETIESVFNNRNYWVNMQSELLLPDPATTAAGTGATSTATGPAPSSGAASGGEGKDDDTEGKGEEEGDSKEASGEDGKEGDDSKVDGEEDGEDGEADPTKGLPAIEPDEDEVFPPSALARETRRKQAEAAESGTAPSGSSARDSIAAMSFDLSNTDNWEYIFIETASLVLPRPGGPAEGAEDPAASMGAGVLDTGLDGLTPVGEHTDTETKTGDAGAETTGAIEDGEHILDIPRSWVPKLVIDRETYMLRYPSGSRTAVYRKAKLERFAPHAHPQGLIARYTSFTDFSRSEVDRVVEVFGSRADKLFKRVRNPLIQTTEEFFLPGRPSGLRVYIDELAHRREMQFYVSARIDGLTRRIELIGKKIMEHYNPGPDSKLLYRSVTLMSPKDAAELAARQARAAQSGPSAAASSKGVSLPTLVSSAGELPILKMTEKFARHPDHPAERDPARRTYMLEDQVIQVQYHHAPGRITASSRLYTKHNSGVELTTVDPFAPPVTQAQLDSDFRAVIIAEKDCISAIKSTQRHVIDLLKHRARQEGSVVLEKTVFETALERAKSGPRDTTADMNDEDDGEKRFDFLAPFLQFVHDPNNITKAEAQRADRDCRKALKERLIERVNIIQRRLDEENEMLQKKQQEFQRNRDQVEGAEEEFEKFCSEAMFRIGILEQRLQRSEETVMSKYMQLEAQLKVDPRLAILNS